MELSKGGTDVYQPRNPRASDYFRCAEAHFEELEMIWDDRYERQYGFCGHEVFKMLKAEGKEKIKRMSAKYGNNA